MLWFLSSSLVYKEKGKEKWTNFPIIVPQEFDNVTSVIFFYSHKSGFGYVQFITEKKIHNG